MSSLAQHALQRLDNALVVRLPVEFEESFEEDGHYLWQFHGSGDIKFNIMQLFSEDDADDVITAIIEYMNYAAENPKLLPWSEWKAAKIRALLDGIGDKDNNKRNIGTPTYSG